MPELLYELSTCDLLLLQDLILWSVQFKRNGTILPDARIRKLRELSDAIDRVVVARAAAGDVASVEAIGDLPIRKAAASEQLTRTAVFRESKTGTKDQ